MFGIKNFTGVSFVGKIGKLSLEFTAGLVEELTFNITAVHAAEIPQDITQNISGKFISKDQIITTTSAVVSSKIVQTKVVDLIIGATPNLFI